MALTMDTLPDTHMRRIRNIEFCSQELSTLLPGRTQKIVGTTIDAFGAVIQQEAESSRSTSTSLSRLPCIFSSWIPAMASGRVREGGLEGTIENHVKAACPNAELEELSIGRVRWAMPLCGGDPAHWVLGWIDFDLAEYGIVDSIPELQSSTWAEPVSIPATACYVAVH
ncbi:hypothetical protein NUW54_g11165 [Trametes sanguinea]|uniref:Uncharacterized protein n=1 Tax=Trametes sanguinea TaxID=158606 RepID=A0ACC1NJZ0_9APHY|nr:hypothetical protein NUW54_g11165 [Trametes sanguinea]